MGALSACLRVFLLGGRHRCECERLNHGVQKATPQVVDGYRYGGCLWKIGM